MSISSLSKDKSVSADAPRCVWILFVAEKNLSTLRDVDGSVMMALNKLFMLRKMLVGQLSSISADVGKFSLSILCDPNVLHPLANGAQNCCR